MTLKPSPTVHFRHADDAAKLRPDDPVLNRTQVAEVFCVAGDYVVEDFSEPRGDRPHLGLRQAFGQFDGTQAFHHLLPGEINVGVVVEDDRDLGEAELGERPDFHKPPQATDGLFHWESDLLFDLDRRQRRRDGVDLDLYRRGIRKSVDGQLRQGEGTRDSQTRGNGDHHKAMPERPINDGGEHRD